MTEAANHAARFSSRAAAERERFNPAPDKNKKSTCPTILHSCREFRTPSHPSPPELGPARVRAIQRRPKSDTSDLGWGGWSSEARPGGVVATFAPVERLPTRPPSLRSGGHPPLRGGIRDCCSFS